MLSSRVPRWLRQALRVAAAISVLAAVVLAVVTERAMRPIPTDLHAVVNQINKPQLLDRDHRPLTVTFQNQWNVHQQVRLERIPEVLQHAFILAEDKRFYQHAGIDWTARVNALLQNILAFEGVRGASTISEQVVRMVHPRPRSVWARWLEGWEARLLERQFDKATILEFYLNQVPYAAQRRGVAQAAAYYFDRDLETLSEKEMLALAVLVRAPSRFDLYKSTARIEGRLNLLIDRAVDAGVVTQAMSVKQQTLTVQRPSPTLDVQHFAQFVQSQVADPKSQIVTTLDSPLQFLGQELLNRRLSQLATQQVQHGALIVVDHQQDEVLVWAVGNADTNPEPTAYDTLLVKRQPGSTLKPFVYASALEQGWTAATLIDDSPLTEGVGRGVHAYRNYSNKYYGEVPLREALGNSLNIPAIKAAQYVGVEPLLARLHALGIRDLALRSVDYGHGIALGNAELSLFQLAEAYAALARGGIYRPLSVLTSAASKASGQRVFSDAASTLIANILSDADARSREFGRGGALHLPIQTAVKTGTSSDYRDAWVMAFNHRYLVGVWMGNLDSQPMQNITGSTGPAMVMRAMFNELNRHTATRPLRLARDLQRHAVCIDSGLISDGNCASRDEWFLPTSLPAEKRTHEQALEYRLAQPVDQMLVARDPRIPDEFEALELRLNQSERVQQVEWLVNDKLVATTHTAHYDWPLQGGHFRVQARVFSMAARPMLTPAVSFTVR
ncbi:hypothetical protein GCM10008090_15560 [Arenicella chitinivorans]|uniref:peptidoglycan glycosyltransferase n=1 Tax=Arenicella chitinivorans TaxID=1329800 RepID=A0A918VJK3_9GAMM|nr:transglycosylase domain-containing protein [Arenicella chitinivorans]GHA06772.1 hypothetical protein GCM10008090_15560 [Arenicella chitinivorans]